MNSLDKVRPCITRVKYRVDCVVQWIVVLRQGISRAQWRVFITQVYQCDPAFTIPLKEV